jgi:crotonobetaine/carnitine-CoA ligase
MRRFGISTRTIVQVVREAARELPDKDWIVTNHARACFADVDALSNRIARGLIGLGMQAGDRLVTMLPDSITQIAIWLACAKLGVLEVPINTAYRGDILRHVVGDCGAHVAVIATRFAPRFAELEACPPELRHLVLMPDSEDPGAAGIGGGRITGLETVSLEVVLSENASDIGDPPAERDIMAIMYTSGTTGRSKGVMVTHAHAYEYALAITTALQLDAGDIYYSSGLPLFHIAGRWGVALAAAIAGATVAIPAQFSARNYWSDVRGFGASATFLLGAMANFLQRQPMQAEDRENPLRKVLMCPLLADLAVFAERFGVAVATAYGSTEANAPVIMPLGAPVSDHQIVGQVRGDRFELMVADETDNPVAPGVLGEIMVRSKQPWILMQGYWNQPEATTRAWRNLWLHTGDAGRLDADGNVYFVDRLQDTIRRRGENISSMEVEGILSQHPAIAECAVFPVASENTEQDVMAALVLKPEERPDPEGLIRWLEVRMPSFMIPRYLDFVAHLPKTPTGKITKAALRDGGVTATTWDRERAGIRLAR